VIVFEFNHQIISLKYRRSSQQPSVLVAALERAVAVLDRPGAPARGVQTVYETSSLDEYVERVHSVPMDPHFCSPPFHRCHRLGLFSSRRALALAGGVSSRFSSIRKTSTASASAPTLSTRCIFLATPRAWTSYGAGTAERLKDMYDDAHFKGKITKEWGQVEYRAWINARLSPSDFTLKIVTKRFELLTGFCET
jgi:hypothetical protein